MSWEMTLFISFTSQTMTFEPFAVGQARLANRGACEHKRNYWKQLGVHQHFPWLQCNERVKPRKGVLLYHKQIKAVQASSRKATLWRSSAGRAQKPPPNTLEQLVNAFPPSVSHLARAAALTRHAVPRRSQQRPLCQLPTKHLFLSVTEKKSAPALYWHRIPLKLNATNRWMWLGMWRLVHHCGIEVLQEQGSVQVHWGRTPAGSERREGKKNISTMLDQV